MGNVGLACKFPPSLYTSCFSAGGMLCLVSPSCWFRASPTVRPGKRGYVPPKYRLDFIELQGVISQKTEQFNIEFSRYPSI
jgi:hypothetical protein